MSGFSEKLTKLVGFNPFDPSTFTPEYAALVEDLRSNPEKRAIAVEKSQALVAEFRISFPTINDFHHSRVRKETGKPYILIDDPAKVGFSHMKNFKRAILLQTEPFGFVPRVGFECLQEGKHFDFLQVGRGKKGKIETYVSPLVFSRIIYGKKSDFEPQDGVSPDERFKRWQAEQVKARMEEVNFFYYRHIERVRQSVVSVLGYSPGFKEGINPFWTLERELKLGRSPVPHYNDRRDRVNQDFESQGLYTPTQEEIDAYKRAIARNKPSRMARRLGRILRR